MSENLYFDGAKDIELNYITKVHGEQDGAMYGGYLFRFDGSGLVSVTDLSDYSLVNTHFADGMEKYKPHGNSVFFGSEMCGKFPLLYSNVYNSYNNANEGICLVYKITDDLKTILVQVIKIGFVDKEDVWRSKDKNDVRPYGNFAYDKESGLMYAFTMRDGDRTARFFEFKMPKLSDGEVVTINYKDVTNQFDTPYIDFMQGAICHKGYIYSLEGFNAVNAQKPKLKVIDVKGEKMAMDIDLTKHGLIFEMELVEVYNDTLYLSDCWGNTFTATFK